MTFARTAGIFLAATGVGYVIGEVMAKPVHDAVSLIPFPAPGAVSQLLPHHHEIGQGMATIGIFSLNPLLAGVGAGLLVSDRKDWFNRKNRVVKYTTGVGKDDNFEYPQDEINIVGYDIPDFLPSVVRYRLIGNVFREIVTKPTWNAKKGIMIPPGREHPAVITTARQILNEYGVDGRDRIGVLKAIQQWTQKNIRYVHDPRSLDTFYHPYRLLEVRAGDCLPFDTPILMYDGTTKQINSIAVGHVIIGKDGTPTTVTNRWNKGIKPTIRLGFSNNTFLNVTENHKMILANGAERSAGVLSVGNSLLTASEISHNTGPVTVKSIGVGPTVPVYDIETENHSIYLPENDIVVHNCDCQALLASSLGEALSVPMAMVLVAQRNRGLYNHVLSGGYWDEKFYPIETIRKVEWGYMPKYINEMLIPMY